ncbi:putative F-box protein PP2-B8 [Cryptomeria japonica]|uniref:putative F-box protein PP2-B8 n=1 Tax=Cryptomeria japonica TaxID=3369 RepID=UPI0025AD37B4|nr:putative F-box protein PP2-B8 [Cryptomeria japonica]
MEISRGRKNCATLEDLPENCISLILSFTTVIDLCCLAPVSQFWRSAANENSLWERMIDQRFGNEISKAISTLAFPSRKDLYISLIKDHKTKSIWSEISTEKICCMIPATDLIIAQSYDLLCWEWVRRDDSRFAQVARLRYVWMFDIWQCFKCSILSANTHYKVSFIIRLDNNFPWSRHVGYPSPFIFSVVAPDGVRMESARFLDDLEKPVENHGKGFSMTPFSENENGWLEFVAGEFFLKEEHLNGGAKEIEFSMKNTDSTFMKTNIWVEGVKIEPKH